MSFCNNKKKHFRCWAKYILAHWIYVDDGFMWTMDLCGSKKSGFFVLLLIKDENVCGIGHTEFRFQTLL